ARTEDGSAGHAAIVAARGRPHQPSTRKFSPKCLSKPLSIAPRLCAVSRYTHVPLSTSYWYWTSHSSKPDRGEIAIRRHAESSVSRKSLAWTSTKPGSSPQTRFSIPLTEVTEPICVQDGTQFVSNWRWP